MFNMLEYYLNQTKVEELVDAFPLINPKEYDLRIRLEHYDEVDDTLVVCCHILWMETIIKFNHKFVLDSKEIRKFKLMSLK